MPIFLLQIPLGGDFYSLIDRATADYDSTQHDLVFNFLVNVSNFFEINISSLYSIVIYLFYILICLSRKTNPIAILNPFIFVFFLTGFQRYALSIVLFFLAVIMFDYYRGLNKRSGLHKYTINFTILLLLIIAFNAHPSILFCIIIFILSKFLKIQWSVTILFLALLLFSSLGLLIPVFSHYYQHYFIESAQSSIWVLFALMAIIYTVLNKNKNSLGSFSTLLILSTLFFLYMDANIMAYRVLMLWLFASLIYFKGTNLRLLLLNGSVSVLFLYWFLSSDKASLWNLP